MSARHGVSFHEFAHIDPHDSLLVIEEKLGQGLCKLRLADAGRPRKRNEPRGLFGS